MRTKRDDDVTTWSSVVEPELVDLDVEPDPGGDDVARATHLV
jgi:hypothetical protein